jgi:hypothetical protein
MKGLLSGRETILEGADVAFFLEYNKVLAKKFHEAYNHPKLDARVKWHEAIGKELEDMKKKEYGE